MPLSQNRRLLDAPATNRWLRMAPTPHWQSDIHHQAQPVAPRKRARPQVGWGPLLLFWRAVAGGVCTKTLYSSVIAPWLVPSRANAWRFQVRWSTEPGSAYRDVQYFWCLAVTPDNGGTPAAALISSRISPEGFGLAPCVFPPSTAIGSCFALVITNLRPTEATKRLPLSFLLHVFFVLKPFIHSWIHSPSVIRSVSNGEVDSRPHFTLWRAYTALHIRRRQPVNFPTSHAACLDLQTNGETRCPSAFQ